MYLWKCWRDTRTAFLVFLVVVAGCGAFGFFVLWDVGGWTSARALPGVWRETGRLLVGAPGMLMSLAGFILGAYGIGEELGKGSLPFLLTRPRARRYFVWTNWLVGAAQVTGLILLGALLRHTAPAATGRPRGPFDAVSLRLVLIVALLGLVTYSVTFFFAVVLRSGRLGTNAAVGVVFSYFGAAFWLAMRFEVYVPPFFKPGLPAEHWFRWGQLAGWLAVALAFAYAAQRRFERSEA